MSTKSWTQKIPGSRTNWRIVDGGDILARSETMVHKANALRSAEPLKGSARSGAICFESFLGCDRRWRWRARVVSNDEILVSSTDSYTSVAALYLCQPAHYRSWQGKMGSSPWQDQVSGKDHHSVPARVTRLYLAALSTSAIYTRANVVVQLYLSRVEFIEHIRA